MDEAETCALDGQSRYTNVFLMEQERISTWEGTVCSITMKKTKLQKLINKLNCAMISTGDNA
jgi:hypothetical protein